jgi:hypothetical protein
MQYPSNLFNFSKHLGMLVTRAGVLQHAARGLPIFEPVNDRTADEGMHVISTGSGEEASFYVSHVDKKHDGTVKSWLLKPTLDTVIRLPQLSKAKILVVA